PPLSPPATLRLPRTVPAFPPRRADRDRGNDRRRAAHERPHRPQSPSPRSGAGSGAASAVEGENSGAGAPSGRPLAASAALHFIEAGLHHVEDVGDGRDRRDDPEIVGSASSGRNEERDEGDQPGD